MAPARDPATGRFVKSTPPLVPLKPPEVKALARKVFTNEVWVAWTGEELENSFGMLLALARPGIIPPNVSTMYAGRRDALPLAVNGHPTFLSGRFLCHEDLVALVAELERIEAALA